MNRISPEQMDKLEAQRVDKQKRGRITYNCFNLKYNKDGRVQCSKGRLLTRSKDGSMDELSALRGITSGACKDCPDYND